MRILAFSDFHGMYGLTNHFLDVRRKIAETKPDFLILCGDFRNELSIPLLESRLRRLNLSSIYYVWGNSDGQALDFALKIGTNLHLKLIALSQEFMLCGLGGDELDVVRNLPQLEQLLSEKSRSKLILISHVPPFGCCDMAVEGSHAGSKLYRQFIDNHPPVLCLFGHIHEAAQQMLKSPSTTFWNVGPKGIFIEL
jgi:Icc-related predicted phosphoesterase